MKLSPTKRKITSIGLHEFFISNIIFLLQKSSSHKFLTKLLLLEPYPLHTLPSFLSSTRHLIFTLILTRWNILAKSQKHWIARLKFKLFLQQEKNKKNLLNHFWMDIKQTDNKQKPLLENMVHDILSFKVLLFVCVCWMLNGSQIS